MDLTVTLRLDAQEMHFIEIALIILNQAVELEALEDLTSDTSMIDDAFAFMDSGMIDDILNHLRGD